MKNFKNLLEHQLKNLYNTENQWIEILPRIIENISDERLKFIFIHHLEETKKQKKQLEQVCNDLDIEPTGEKCTAMEGLLKETKDFLSEVADINVMNAGLIAEAQKVAHYKISGYCITIRYAKELGYCEVSRKLQKILNEKYDIDDKLEEIAENRMNKKAMA
ncbi:ferritin-like domain-containing protein [Aquimarina sp. RZ0]|uniref:YciE/YciF ferroxidase family protein n=1 Tax=Aquimarina sp. RZ0 TaxID=2607730 RepID=UPI0011F16D4E|nr:DUF892 family protein [Aquimarina sp. RZ0]KAA1244192.1 DUF892 family protein [Aquimarina sp. RZ0]